MRTLIAPTPICCLNRSFEDAYFQQKPARLLCASASVAVFWLASSSALADRRAQRLQSHLALLAVSNSSTISVPVAPDSPVPFATALSTSSSRRPHLQATGLDCPCGARGSVRARCVVAGPDRGWSGLSVTWLRWTPRCGAMQVLLLPYRAGIAFERPPAPQRMPLTSTGAGAREP
jgi:hypothetical protein